MDNLRLFISYQLLGIDRRWHFINLRTTIITDKSNATVLNYLSQMHHEKEVILNFIIEDNTTTNYLVPKRKRIKMLREQTIVSENE